MNLWPWRSKRTGCPTDESREAIRQADRAILDADRRDEAVADVAERLRQTRIRNHFREAVEDTMRRRTTT